MTFLLLAAVVTALVAPTARRLMVRLAVMDVPNDRSSHVAATPRGGGWACLAGTLAVVAAAFLGGVTVPVIPFAGAVVLALVGYVDDHRNLGAVSRLATQVGVGIVVGWSAGGLPTALLGAIAVPWVVNMVNFMDGINGITSLTMGLWGATALYLGVSHDRPPLALIGAAAAGSALGFLPWNVPVAKLFLGDIGSYLFGGLVAAGLLLSLGSASDLLLLCAPVSLYAVDTAFTLARRAWRGDRLLTAHRQHTYQQLTRIVGSHAWVSLAMALTAGAITLVWATGDVVMGAVVTLVLCTGYLLSEKVLRKSLSRSHSVST